LLWLLLVNAIFTRDFLTLQTLNVNLSQVAQIVVVAMGMALVIATAGIDLSVGAVAAFAGTLAAVLLTREPLAHTGLALPAALLLPLVAAGALGLMNGLLITRYGIQPIVATLVLFIAGRVLAGVTGIMNVAMISAADPAKIGLNIELDAIAAVAVGGTLLSGGRVNIAGTLFGALAIQLLDYTLLAHGVADEYALVAKAAII